MYREQPSFPCSQAYADQTFYCPIPLEGRLKQNNKKARKIGQKNAHTVSDVRQVYKGEIEEKLLTDYSNQLTGRIMPNCPAMSNCFLEKIANPHITDILCSKISTNPVILPCRPFPTGKKMRTSENVRPSLQRRNRGEKSSCIKQLNSRYFPRKPCARQFPSAFAAVGFTKKQHCTEPLPQAV
ncbi:hypothetical protein [Neisseria sp.]|uniref:hypothetical protein n=1 Tax=Neisseria sp. TaxID=192066 RepID=UPI0035A10386